MRLKGAYTGEVSPSMVKELCEYVILGHSERRQRFSETDEMVAKKVSAAIDVGLKPILCIGETLAEREAGDATVVVQRQVRAALREVPSLDGVIVAYEPVWAIGTGLPSSPADAQYIMEFIRGLLHEDFGRSALDLPLLYGGSVDAGNVGGFVAQPDINGALVGSASLDADGFVELAKNARAASGIAHLCLPCDRPTSWRLSGLPRPASRVSAWRSPKAWAARSSGPTAGKSTATWILGRPSRPWKTFGASATT